MEDVSTSQTYQNEHTGIAIPAERRRERATEGARAQRGFVLSTYICSSLSVFLERLEYILKKEKEDR